MTGGSVSSVQKNNPHEDSTRCSCNPLVRLAEKDWRGWGSWNPQTLMAGVENTQPLWKTRRQPLVQFNPRPSRDSVSVPRVSHQNQGTLAVTERTGIGVVIAALCIMLGNSKHLVCLHWLRNK